MSQTDHLQAISAYVDQHAQSMLDQLKTLTRQPSISAQDVGVKECAELLAQMLHDDGIEAQILPTAGQPVIVGTASPLPESADRRLPARGTHVLIRGCEAQQPMGHR